MAVRPASSKQDVVAKPEDQPIDAMESLTVSSNSSSASAAFARSLFLFLGLMFRRPSKLFRPSRVDTWGGLRQLAQSADQTLSPAFIKSLLRRKSGMIALTLTIIPPLAINTTLGFLLFTSHSVFALGLARIPFFQHHHHHMSGSASSSDTYTADEEDEEEEEEITIETLLRGPHIIPAHPTLLSAIAGAGAGLVQGMAFTPVENLVRLLSQSASSITAALGRLLNLPSIKPTTSPSTPISPIEALRKFLSSEAWVKSPGWWTGWRWTVARDALSYGVFFAAFDITRRCGLRMKALFGGSTNPEWNNILTITRPSDDIASNGGPKATPTRARVAQATTIVAGGVTASILAEIAGRPFRTCQRLMTEQAHASGSGLLVRGNPVLEMYRRQGIRPFLRKDGTAMIIRERGVGQMAKRLGWRLAAVGPWGFGFLVWAWVGGEV